MAIAETFRLFGAYRGTDTSPKRIIIAATCSISVHHLFTAGTHPPSHVEATICFPEDFR